MKIREAKTEDIQTLNEMAVKYKLDLPPDGTVIVAETNSGKIEAFAILRGVYFVEPLISENPLATKDLWDYIKEKSIKKNVRILRCFAEPKHFKLLKKIGFYQVFEKKIPMEINFYNQ